MQSKEERQELVQRLDGYLDALSLLNGNLRECRYFAYLKQVKAVPLQEQLQSLYVPHSATVEFGSLTALTPWLGPLEQELQQTLLGNLLGSTLGASRAKEEKRIRQAAWYTMEMIRTLTDDFTASPEIHKCPITVATADHISTGVLYILPIGPEYLVITLQWQNAA